MRKPTGAKRVVCAMLSSDSTLTINGDIVVFGAAGILALMCLICSCALVIEVQQRCRARAAAPAKV